MKVIVAIANFGTKNKKYLEMLLKEYRGMTHFEIHLVVLSDIPKDLGSDVEVIVGLPSKDPWSLPFGHKKIFAQRINDYDLFIYSEDDTLIKESNICAFLNVTKRLPKDKIAGFIRYEEYLNDGKYFTTVHGHYHWDPSSIIKLGKYCFAHFTNDHSACFILTREQLKKAIKSGGFLTKPRKGEYDMLCTAATDPYSNCGFEKMICISHLEDFSLHHLPNVYKGKMGISYKMLNLQIKRMLEVANGGYSQEQLFETTRLIDSTWKKKYFEDARTDILRLLSKNYSSVLSVGCGWGATEEELIKKGASVTGVPLDSVIAACSESRGIKTTSPNPYTALSELKNIQFDCLLFANILEYLENPEKIFKRYIDLLKTGGTVGIVVHNFKHILFFKNKLSNKGTNKDIKNISSFQNSRLERLTREKIKKLLLDVDLSPTIELFQPDDEHSLFSKITLGAIDRWLSRNIYIFAKKR